MKTSVNQIYFVIMLVLLPIAGLYRLTAAETFTNWNGVAFGLVVPKTNLVAGEKVFASIVISNALDTEYHVPWSRNLCSCGFGEFSIVEMSSGKTIDCNLSREGRMFHSFSLGTIKGHESQSFQFDLSEGYALTNRGIFIVQAKGWLPERDAPKQRSIVLTPPLVLWLSPETESNVSSK